MHLKTIHLVAWRSLTGKVIEIYLSRSSISRGRNFLHPIKDKTNLAFLSFFSWLLSRDTSSVNSNTGVPKWRGHSMPLVSDVFYVELYIYICFTCLNSL